jgi:hypothetical protein
LNPASLALRGRPTTAITAVARNRLSARLDLVAVGDGLFSRGMVRTAGWSPATGWSGWSGVAD